VQTLAFVLAFVLSVAVETGVVFLISRRRPVPRRFVAVLLANAASYALIASIAWRLPWWRRGAELGVVELTPLRCSAVDLR
jgi:hypothetical protein